MDSNQGRYLTLTSGLYIYAHLLTHVHTYMLHMRTHTHICTCKEFVKSTQSRQDSWSLVPSLCSDKSVTKQISKLMTIVTRGPGPIVYVPTTWINIKSTETELMCLYACLKETDIYLSQRVVCIEKPGLVPWKMVACPGRGGDPVSLWQY